MSDYTAAASDYHTGRRERAVNDLDEKVEYWHTHDTGTTLREFLQMTEVEYIKFMYGIDLSPATTQK